jgi:hypothetical protein
MQGAIFDLQSKMLAMQEKMGSLAEEKRNAEAKLVELSNWQVEAAKYGLFEPGGGAILMVLKDEKDDSAPNHWLCPNCFEKKKRSYLAWNKTGFGLKTHEGAECRYSVMVVYDALHRKPTGTRLTDLLFLGFTASTFGSA